MKQRVYYNRKRNIYFILPVLLLALFTAWWQVEGAANWSIISELNQKQLAIKEELDEFEKTLQKEEQIKKNWLNLNSKAKSLKISLPCTNQTASALTELENILVNYKDNLENLQIGEIEYEENKASIPVTLSTSGSPAQVNRIIRDLENFPHWIIFNSVCWTAFDNNHAALDLKLELIFVHFQASPAEEEYRL